MRKLLARISISSRILLLIVLVIMGFFLVKSIKTQRMIREREARIEQLNADIASEQERTKEIKAMQEYMHSDEYKKQVAKEQLGLVEDGEIIFKPDK